MNEYEKRINIAKEAVKTVRTKADYGFKVLSPPVIMTAPKEWAFGVIGILDFVLTGDPNKILIHEVKAEVKTALSLNQRQKEAKE